MKKILISGYIGFNNFGDEAIFQALCEHLRDYKISVLANCEYKNIVSYPRFNILKILEAISNCDVLISGGGSLLQNKTSNVSLLYYLFIILLAKFLNKKVIIFAQGFEKIKGNFFEKLTAFSLKNVDFVSVRDEKSQKYLESIGVNSTCLSDPIYSILDSIEPKQKSGLIVQLRDVADRKLIKELAEAIKENYKGKITVLALQKDYDEGICLEFKKYFKDIEYYYHKDIYETIDLINSAKYMISTRLHGLIVSNALKNQTFALSYDDKINTLIDELELQNIDIYNYNKDELYQKLKRFFSAQFHPKSYRKFEWNEIDEALK